ncbi:hypothetical protein L3X38_003258 [Prunus dulcis]|uniref:Transposable element protein n=6 Tax=Prunus dulcis TaxID=3755 RepID=A0AAD4ZLR9_PRUDU|nr:hypothetical protein L3X38_003258 [Prunus dulcis]
MDSVETNNVKPGKFNGTNFKRWQRQLKYWLTVLGLVSALEDQTTPDKTTETTSKTKEKMTKEELEYHCHNRILSALSDDLYDVYQDTKNAKTLWDELEAEYGIEDAGIDRFTISNFNNYMMVENKTVSEQIHEYQDFLRKIELKGTKFSEEFKVSCLIDKLPPSWLNFAKTLRHKQRVLTLTQVLNSLRIEEKHKSSNKPKEEKTNVNLVETSNNRNRFQSGRKFFKRTNRNSQPNHNQFNRNQNRQHNRPHNNSNGNKDQPCFVCGRTNHWAKDCHYKKTEPYKPKPKWNKGQSGPKAQVNVLVDQDEPNLRYSFKPLVNVAYLSNSDWWLDSGANVHVCFDKRFFKNYQNSSGGSVTLGNDTVAQVRGIGEVELKMTSGKTLTLKDVRHVPEVRRNLISGSSLVKQGYKIVMESNRIVITRNDVFIGKGYVCDGLFKINVVFEDNKISPQVFNVESCNVWHGRLGHVSLSKIKTLMDLELIPKSNIDLKHKCEVCVQAKQTRNSFKPVERNTQILELIHSDVCDSNRSPTRGGNKYFVTFIDDFSRYCHIYLIKTKDEVFNKLKIYKNEVENQLEKKIKRLRSDRGGEYTSNELGVFCEEHGIIHEVTPPYSPQSNGVAERKNRTLMDMVNSMLLSSGLPENLWGEAMLTACFILNRITLKDNEKTPYELWKRRSPNLRILKVWGCLAKVLIPDPKRKKIGPKTIDAVFLGYAKNSSANRFLVINSEVKEVANNTIMEARDATFFEDIFPYKTRISKEVQISEKPSSSTTIENLESQELRRSKRARVEKNFGDDFYTFLVEGDPSTYKEAVMSVDAPFWKEAINDEFQSIIQNNTWMLTNLPAGNKAIGCKWVFRKKLKPDGSIDKYKARLVAKGFTQKKGIDYFDTYSPVSRITTIRTLIALASVHNLVIHQMDVKTAFLNGDLDEEIYMEQPEGFIVKGQEHKVCKLVKSLYGLKQAPKQWHEKFDKVILDYDFKFNGHDKCVYYKENNGEHVILCLYVDDILIFGTNLEIVNNVKSYLSRNFDMKDMGEANVILGMKIEKTTQGISLSQSSTIEKMLKKFNYFECKPTPTPYDPNVHLKKNQGEPFSQLKYSQMIGSLLYIANKTRPDIAYAVGRLSRYTHNPSKEHWNALERVFKYLRGTIDYSLCYKGFPNVIEGYSDANWITDNEEVKSTSGYIFLLGGAAISWGSKKQTIISRSTMESELIALDTTCTEAEWIKSLLMDMPMVEKPLPALSIHCDCKATIDLVKQSHTNRKMNRHIHVRYKSMKSLLSKNIVSLDYVKSENNIADQLTKGLSRSRVLEMSRGMGLSP